MFQYAAARSLADRLGVELQLDLSWFSDSRQRQVVTRRSYELAAFTLAPSVTIRRVGLVDGVRSRIMSGDRLREYREAHYHFDPAFHQLPDNVVLDGYWQSERYFAAQGEEIRADFTFLNPPSSKNASYLEQIQACNAVSVHIRRNDYTSDEISRIYGATDLTYYGAAIRLIERVSQDLRYFVFSDDLAWCKHNLDLPSTAVFVEGNDGRRSFEDMRLMSACRHHIIANSSFSWWGAWLNPDPHKHVVAPKRWFMDEKIRTEDVVPGGWSRI